MVTAAVYGRQSSNKTKSISEQLAEGHKVISAERWKHAGDYQDGRSASRFSTKPRGGWREVVLAVQSGAFNVLVLWESSRGDRTPESWFAFLSSCRETGVRIHVITHDRTYDLRVARDWKILAEDGVSNAYETEVLSIRTKRGHAGAAAKGLPAGGPTPYGYKRTFDPNTGKRLGQVISEPEASVVRDIFRRVAEGHPILAIANDLSASVKLSKPWTRHDVRRIVRNPAYVALRSHNGTTHQGTWEAIVDEGLFYAAQNVLNQPGRTITRPGRQKHLLSYLAMCECGRFLEQAVDTYRCSGPRHCVSIPKEIADATVSRMVTGRLSKPDAYKELISTDDKSIQANQGALLRLKARLEEARMKAARGELSFESLTVIETALVAEIETTERKARVISLPLPLRDMLEPGTDVRQRWEDATVVAQRAVIKALCDIRIGKGTPGRKSDFRRLGASRWRNDQKTWADYWD